MEDKNAQVSGAVYGLLAATIWGAWPVLSRAAVGGALGPQEVAVLRFGVAGLVLLPYLLRRGLGHVGLAKACVIAAGAGVPYVLIMMRGLELAPAGHAGVITPSVMLLVSSLGGALLLKDRISVSRLIGLGVIVAGLVTLGSASFGALEGNQWQGDLLFALGGLLWASYTVACRAWSIEPFHATALVSVLSLVALVPLTLASGTPGLLQAPFTEVVFQGVFQGLFAAILALLFYSRSVALLGASRGAVFAALVPGLSVLLAYPVLGEVPSLHELAGLAVVSLGVSGALGLWPSRCSRLSSARQRI